MTAKPSEPRGISQPIKRVARSAWGRVSRAPYELSAARNCTRDEGGPFGFGDQEPISSHRKLLRTKAVVVLCQEGARAPCCTRDEGGPFGAVLKGKASNRHELLRSKAAVVNVMVKRRDVDHVRCG